MLHMLHTYHAQTLPHAASNKTSLYEADNWIDGPDYVPARSNFAVDISPTEIMSCGGLVVEADKYFTVSTEIKALTILQDTFQVYDIETNEW